MEESREIRALRSMAWERAKGELESMYHTYWESPNYSAFVKLVEEFISKIEDEGLQE